MNSRLASALLFCLVFGCGVFAGLLADHLLEGHTVPVWNFADQSRPHVIDMVRSDLSLTDDQTHQVEAILDDASHQFNDLHARAQDVRAQAKDRIRSVLNEDQKKKFEASMVKLQKVIAANQ
jgi:Spy/CpxP family protein refolding chaperone